MINKKAVTAVLMLSMFFCMKAAFAEPETADTAEAAQTESVYDAEANPERYSDAVGVDVYIDYKWFRQTRQLYLNFTTPQDSS